MPLDSFITQMQDAMTARRVFAEPYEKDGVTVIPAAKVSGGGGGGNGQDKEGGGGEGGGFGLHARPAGAFVVKDGEVTWRPAVDANRIVLAAAAVAVVALLTRGRRGGSSLPSGVPRALRRRKRSPRVPRLRR
jgi:uncharacterized spore protein YtfJ